MNMENIEKFSLIVQNRNIELIMSPSQNPNGLYAILINVREKGNIIGTVRLNIQWVDYLKFIDYSYSWHHFFEAAYQLFKQRKYAEYLFAKKGTSIIDIDEQFEFL